MLLRSDCILPFSVVLASSVSFALPCGQVSFTSLLVLSPQEQCSCGVPIGRQLPKHGGAKVDGTDSVFLCLPCVRGGGPEGRKGRLPSLRSNTALMLGFSS